jgi:hypothetical protein
MFNPLLVTGLATVLMMSGPAHSDQAVGAASLGLEPAINGAVSASGLFPTQGMEDELTTYLRWTKERGISRLAAFESLIDGDAAGASLPDEQMSAEFQAYLRWVEAEDLSPFYAFMVTDFD